MSKIPLLFAFHNILNPYTDYSFYRSFCRSIQMELQTLARKPSSLSLTLASGCKTKITTPLFLKYGKSLDVLTLSTIQSRQRFCCLSGLENNIVSGHSPTLARRGSTNPSASILKSYFTSEEALFICFYFFNMTYLVLNNLWTLSGNSEQSSSHSAWKQKINGCEIWDQNQAGFTAASETHKKSQLELRHAILTQSKSRSTRYSVCKYIYAYICIYIYLCICMFPTL